MELRIKPTPQFFMAGNVMVRMWQGTAIHDDDSSEPCVALVSMVGFAGQAEAMAAGLVSIPPPTAEDARAWAAEVLSKRYDEDDVG